MSKYPQAGLWRHYKGHLYLVLGIAHDANDDRREVVVYVPLELDGAHAGPRLAVRSVEDFGAVVCSVCKERFDQDRHAECNSSTAEARFTYIGQTYNPR